MARVSRVIVTCEHGGAHVPAEHRALFRNAEGAAALASHRGFDPGALALARDVARALGAPLHFSTTSRLLIELNRSLHHPALFSRFTRRLSPEQKRALVERHYAPYRAAVEASVRAALRAPGAGAALHLSVHSFTPELDGVVRTADIGLLYDPARRLEAALCDRWRSILREVAPTLRVRRNYPYRGAADGFTTHLRRAFPARRYAGIELEVNQSLLMGDAAARGRVHRAVVESLRGLVATDA